MSERQQTEKNKASPGWATPLSVIVKKHGLFFGYIFALFAACIGIIIYFVLPEYSNNYSNAKAWDVTLRSGSYYFLIVSLLVTSTVQMKDSWELRKLPRVFEQIKTSMYYLAFSVILVSLGGGGLLEVVFPSPALEINASFEWLTRDYFQMFMFGVGLLVVIYSFLLITYEEELDHFAQNTDERKINLNDNAAIASDDGRGMRL